MNDRAVALAAAIEALSEGPARVLAAELRELLEESVSVAAVIPSPPASGVLETPSGPSKAALRARRAREKKKERERQLALAFEGRDASRLERDDRDEKRDASRDANAVSLSDLISEGNEERAASRVTPPSRSSVTLDPEVDPPERFAALAAELRPELAAEHVRRSYRRFAKTRARWPSIGAAEARWESWIEHERAPSKAPESGSQAEQRAGPGLVHAHQESTKLLEQIEAYADAAAPLEAAGLNARKLLATLAGAQRPP